jgi:hypothetical protein
MRLELGVVAQHNRHKMNLRKGGCCGHVKVWKKIDFSTFHLFWLIISIIKFL